MSLDNLHKLTLELNNLVNEARHRAGAIHKNALELNLGLERDSRFDRALGRIRTAGLRSINTDVMEAHNKEVLSAIELEKTLPLEALERPKTPVDDMDYEPEIQQ